MDESQRITRYLKELRKRAGLSLSRASGKSGVSEAQLKRIEQGTLAPGPEDLDAILKSYNIDPTKFDDPRYIEKIFRDPNPRRRYGKQWDRDKNCGIEDEEWWDYWHGIGKKRNAGENLEDCDFIRSEYNDWKEQNKPDVATIILYRLDGADEHVQQMSDRWATIDRELASLHAIPESDARVARLLKERESLEDRAAPLYFRWLEKWR